jgi:hypothetical protein
MNKMTVASAMREAGRVSLGNGKMPGSTFAVTVDQCKVGRKLAEIKGSTCYECYAKDIERYRPSVHQGWTNNYFKATRMIAERPDLWAKAMAFQIEKAADKSGERFHRWFDGGDLDSLAMLRAIVLTCELTPTIKHWLPTREAAVVKAFLKDRAFPANLVVRVSSTMIGDKPLAYANTSTVHRKGEDFAGYACPARHQGNQCGSCRACWSGDVPNVSYPLH